MTKPILLFDMDGTLIIQGEKPAYTGTLTQYGSYMSIKRQMKEIVVKHGVPAEHVMDLNRMAHIWNSTRHYLEDHGYSEAQIQSVIDEINVPFMVEERADHAVSVLLPSTIEGLISLKRLGYEMGLVTTASRESYDRISTQNEYGCFGKFFKHSITRDECKYIKPEPEPIYRILKHYSQTGFVYIGDADHDAQASRAAGGKFVLINTREYDAETVKELSPDTVISTLDELPEALTLLE
jgi:phosphoglycolate phosphatase-like HAD superfamily hydrolase